MGKYFSNNYALDLSKKVLTTGEVTDKDVINQSIEAILMTGVGERVFEDFGSLLSTVIFERLDASSAENLLDSIISTIVQYEKRITIQSNMCSLNISRAQHSLHLKIVYYINVDGSSSEFNKKIIF